MKTLINNLKEFKKKNLYQSDIWEIKQLVYEFINNSDFDSKRLDYILDEIKDKSDIEDLICTRIRILPNRQLR